MTANAEAQSAQRAPRDLPPDGLVLPGATDIAPVLTPLAAAGLVIVMIGAAATHLRRHEPKFVLINASLLVLASIVAGARFGPYSF